MEDKKFQLSANELRAIANAIHFCAKVRQGALAEDLGAIYKKINLHLKELTNDQP